ncbi:uncharacterized protein A4U43_C07F10550 [Asparagus officinalis]|uniref:Uncharacterized protein n=1 Tax=Asparagus officinalis TaxID=4686 RepID=A0A5P1EG24_ASPOF|nr:uncharacterized protein LOC109848455 [Asparagus officinalis]ONK63020.1 uncharacterized protein A4U43_C07F10550 [Asparagus officinalis]
MASDDDYDTELRRMSRLSIETSDGDEADAEMSDDEKYPSTKKNSGDDGDDDECFVLEGTEALGRDGPVTDTGRARRKRWVEKKWKMKRSDSNTEQCRVLVRPRGPDSESICMDLDEVKACRELGLELPSDWTVEIPRGFSGVDTSSGADSPIASWRISSPGDDPRDVKARLKMWAQAVALASASSLSG